MLSDAVSHCGFTPCVCARVCFLCGFRACEGLRQKPRLPVAATHGILGALSTLAKLFVPVGAWPHGRHGSGGPRLAPGSGVFGG